MTDYARERDAARRHGFARPRPKLPVMPLTDGVQPPVSLIERLEVRPGMRVALVGVEDPDLPSLVAGCTTRCTSMVPRDRVDMLIFQAEGTFDLKRVPDLSRAVDHGGALWVLWPRGLDHITHAHVHRAGVAAGLIDVKTVSVSERLAGLKFVYGRGGS